MRTEPVSLGANRAARENDPRKVTPRDALLHVIARIDKGELPISHILIVCGHSDNDVTSFETFNAGSFDRFGQIGLLTDAARIFGSV